jgi:hypothetical protein
MFDVRPFTLSQDTDYLATLIVANLSTAPLGVGGFISRRHRVSAIVVLPFPGRIIAHPHTEGVGLRELLLAQGFMGSH